MPCEKLLVTWRTKRHLLSTSKNIFLYLLNRRDHGHPPRRGPDSPFVGAARAECRPSRLLVRRVRAIIRLSCRLLIPPTPGSTKCPTAGPENNNTFGKVSLLLPRSRPTTLASGAASLRPPPAPPAAMRENRCHCLNCHEDTHYLRNCRHPFINASGCINPELGQLGDDDAFRRWQERMVSYRRDGTSSRSQTNNKNR